MPKQVYGITPPERVMRGWEPSSLNLDHARIYCQRHLTPESWGTPIRAVVWERANGDIALVVAEYANGRRAEVRRQGHDFIASLKWWNHPSPPAGEGDPPRASGVRGVRTHAAITVHL